MTLALGITAAALFLLYSWYFIRIIKGNPRLFELELLKSLARWMVQKGPASKGRMWLMYWSSLLIEAGYLGMAYITLGNPFMHYFTITVMLLEIYHLIWLGFSFKSFFAGRRPVGKLFNWNLERLSALTLFSYSLLLLITLAFFPAG
ncbi:MAG TPA: hypothetical protein P5273_09790 [Syntrophomonadaceae bacterium]|nr:hypothetical protein [Syntrophomonadaceae bacterium]